MAENPALHALREGTTIDGERAPAGNARLVGGLEYDAAEQAHLGLEQAVRVHGLDGFEGVTADQLGEGVGLVRWSHPHRAHLVQGDAHAAFCERPGGLAPGETATDHVYYDATSSGSGAASSTTMVCPHFRHLRVVSPVVFDVISSIPTNPQFGHGTTTGLFQVE